MDCAKKIVIFLDQVRLWSKGHVPSHLPFAGSNIALGLDNVMRFKKVLVGMEESMFTIGEMLRVLIFQASIFLLFDNLIFENTMCFGLLL